MEGQNILSKAAATVEMRPATFKTGSDGFRGQGKSYTDLTLMTYIPAWTAIMKQKSKGGKVKKRIRILGWRTSRTPVTATFGMVLARSISTALPEVPRTAQVVFAFDMDKPKPTMLKLTREELSQYEIV